jgi:hypothetical protein
VSGFGFSLKSIDILREIVPGLSRVVGLVQVQNVALVLPWQAFREAAHR